MLKCGYKKERPGYTQQSVCLNVEPKMNQKMEEKGLNNDRVFWWFFVSDERAKPIVKREIMSRQDDVESGVYTVTIEKISHKIGHR